MSEHRILRRLGAKLRDESRDIVDARLPERLRRLIESLALVEEGDGRGKAACNVVALKRL